MKSAFLTAIKAFVSQVKANHLDYCKSVVAKDEKKQQKKESK
jgi:hypothetical protein